MGKAIGIKVKRAEGRYDPGASKFFGTPTVPANYVESFEDDEIFFCQIRLSDIAEYDKDNLLPHTGYLYVFLYTEDGKYNLRPDVRYYNGQPTHAIEGFNLDVEGYEDYDTEWLMEFYRTGEDADGIKLFGFPSDWNYVNDPPRLMMQYDPLDSEMGFLDSVDGYLYLFFSEDERDFDNINLHLEYS